MKPSGKYSKSGTGVLNSFFYTIKHETNLTVANSKQNERKVLKLHFFKIENEFQSYINHPEN